MRSSPTRLTSAASLIIFKSFQPKLLVDMWMEKACAPLGATRERAYIRRLHSLRKTPVFKPCSRRVVCPRTSPRWTQLERSGKQGHGTRICLTCYKHFLVLPYFHGHLISFDGICTTLWQTLVVRTRLGRTFLRLSHGLARPHPTLVARG